ncbi:MAG: NAD kinase [Erysipelotrichaceae bacterium]|nr:NAD kinase [Erysipelotrichaceae bacterium]
MKKYAIVCKQDKKSIEVSQAIRLELDSIMDYDEKYPELVISVGGDGTMLYSVHKYMYQIESVSFIGIHTGTLGFLTDYQKDEYLDFIEDVKNNKYHIYHRCLLELVANGHTYYALNEVRVENNRRSQVMDIYINHDFFETFRGNGLCISTASGSTAYNKSLGGAVINSSAGLMQLSEIAGIHHNAYRSLGSPLILDYSHKIELRSDNFDGAILGVDQLVFDLKGADRIEIVLSNKKARFIQYRHVPYIQRLKRAYLSD